MATTAYATSMKVEQFLGAHCFAATSSQSGTTTNTAFTITGLTATANIAVGMAVSGTGVPAGSVVASVDSATQVTISKAATASGTVTITFTGDTFKALLVKASPSRTFDGGTTNVGTPGTGTPSAANLGTDETSGTGYTSGGQTLAGQVNPTSSGATALQDWTTDPSWTAATFSATAMIIANNATRLGAAATPLNGRANSVHDFGGTQTVTAGTFTVTLPTADASNAILRIA